MKETETEEIERDSMDSKEKKRNHEKKWGRGTHRIWEEWGGEYTKWKDIKNICIFLKINWIPLRRWKFTFTPLKNFGLSPKTLSIICIIYIITASFEVYNSPINWYSL